MITLNTEKGVVRIDSWTDITERVDYRDKIDPCHSALKEIIGAYEFADKVHCGLPCNQPHNRGYLVSTKDGLVTNIGSDCGKKAFGISWDHAKRSYEKLDRRFRLAETVRSIKARLPAIRERVDAIKREGGTWVYERITDLRQPNRGVPSAIVNTINRMVRAGSPNVVITRELTDAERDLIDAASNRGSDDEQDDDTEKPKRPKRPRLTDETIGTLQGFAALRQDRDLRRLLVEDVEEMWRIAEQIDDQTASDVQLGRVARWGGKIDASLDLAQETTLLGKTLLTGNNLRVLLRTVRLSDDSKMFRIFLSKLPNE